MNFRVVSDPKYFDKNWNILQHAIREIFKCNDNARHLSFAELHRHAYYMVLHNFGDKLYSGLVATMTSHLQEIARSLEATQGSSFMEELNTKWNDYYKSLPFLSDILRYMERTYIPSTKKTPVYELGLNLWRENVIYSNQIRTRLSNTLLEFVFKERAGEDVNRELIRNVTKMLMDLGPSVYEQVFETPFLQVLAESYKAESQKYIKCFDCGDYLKKVERCLNEETDRVHYLDPKTEKKIINAIEKEMIENPMLRLINMENSGFVNMLCGTKYEDLERMYNLFRRVPNGLSKIKEVMISHIRVSVNKLVTDPKRVKDPVQFLWRLLDDLNMIGRLASTHIKIFLVSKLGLHFL
ncbi:cullin-3A-like protein [Medicago truncatula]|uniref:Cullin-3A-like protein n=1 Tax=Medicago truncatula TaxID=3880 RepID=A0A072U905_MEDTR|nr:cullin-3A-like protein [Medicago truncatula]